MPNTATDPYASYQTSASVWFAGEKASTLTSSKTNLVYLHQKYSAKRTHTQQAGITAGFTKPFHCPEPKY